MAADPEYQHKGSFFDGKPNYALITRTIRKETGMAISNTSVYYHFRPDAKEKMISCQQKYKEVRDQERIARENSQKFKDAYDENNRLTWSREQKREFIEKAKLSAIGLFEDPDYIHRENKCPCRAIQCSREGPIICKIAKSVSVGDGTVEGWYKIWNRENDNVDSGKDERKISFDDVVRRVKVEFMRSDKCPDGYELPENAFMEYGIRIDEWTGRQIDAYFSYAKMLAFEVFKEGIFDRDDVSILNGVKNSVRIEPMAFALCTTRHKIEKWYKEWNRENEN